MAAIKMLALLICAIRGNQIHLEERCYVAERLGVDASVQWTDWIVPRDLSEHEAKFVFVHGRQDLSLKLALSVRHIETLVVGDTNLSSEGYSQLSRAEALRHLHVTMGAGKKQRGFSSQELSYFNEVPTLETLTITGPLTDDGLHTIGKSRTVHTLGLLNTRIRGDLTALKDMVKLTRVGIRSDILDLQLVKATMDSLPDSVTRATVYDTKRSKVALVVRPFQLSASDVAKLKASSDVYSVTSEVGYTRILAKYNPLNEEYNRIVVELRDSK